MSWYKRFIEAEKVQKSSEEFSWVYIDISSKIKDIHTKVADEIDEKDLYTIKQGKGDWSYGIEDKPHITVKFKIPFDNPNKIIKILENMEGGNVSIQDIQIFEQDKYDVLVVECKSNTLNKLHKQLTDKLDIPDDYPDYIPHVTIAYFKKGKAKQYKDMALKEFINKNLNFNFDKVIFQDRENKKTPINL